MITLNMCVERVRLVLSGGYASDQDRVQDQEIKLSIGDVVNKLLNIQTLSVNYNIDGDNIPDGSAIATYEKIPVTRGNGLTSVATLPIIPITLPGRMGVFSVYPSGYPMNEYAPIPVGMIGALMGDKLLNPIARSFYTWDSGRVTIFDDLIGAGITSVDMQLAVMDVTKYDGNEPLPIPADMVDTVINEVVKFYEQFEGNQRRSESTQPAPNIKS